MSAAPVRALFDALRSGDADAVLRRVHPEVEISDPERVGAGPFRGHDEFLRFIGDWMETWEESEAQLEAPVVIGDTVVAFVRHLGRAGGSGVEVDQQGAHLLRLQDRLVVFWRPYTDRSEALRDAGLEGPGMWRTAIETLRTGYEAWNRRDFEALTAFLDEDMEIVPVLDLPDMPAFTGRQGAERFWESSLTTWETFVFTPLAFEPHGDQMLVEVRVNARARGSGIELEEDMAHLYTLRDGNFVRLQAFTGIEQAREALAYPERR